MDTYLASPNQQLEYLLISALLVYESAWLAQIRI